MNNRIITLLLMLSSMSSFSQVGKRYPPERKEYADSTTGRKITVLTNHTGSDTKIYQTHPQWTSDGEWIIFRSARAGRGQAFAVHEKNGDIIQLTAGAGVNTGSMNVCRKSNRVFYFRNNKLIELPLDPIIQLGKQNKTAD